MHFGSAPVRDTYFDFSREDEDSMIRDLMVSTAVKLEMDDDIENFEGIAIEMKEDGFKTSKGWRDFFSHERYV